MDRVDADQSYSQPEAIPLIRPLTSIPSDSEAMIVKANTESIKYSAGPNEEGELGESWGEESEHYHAKHTSNGGGDD